VEVLYLAIVSTKLFVTADGEEEAIHIW